MNPRSFHRGGLLLAIVAGLPLLAQQSSGSLAGRVLDKDSGEPKAGVSISAENIATGQRRAAITDERGAFRMPALPVGNYKVTYVAGDQTYTITRPVNLGADTDATFRFPRKAEQIVVITASSPVDELNPGSSELGVNVSSEILKALPVLDRNVNTAAVIAPGVQIIQGKQVDPTKRSSTYIVSGEGQGRGTNFNVDGGDNNSSDVGGSVFSLPFDAIEQFQVVTNQYRAEFGRSNAGFLNVVSKSGGNEFHGSATAQFTNDSLRARSTDEGEKKSNNSMSTGLYVGGPLIKDKLFYSVAADRTTSQDASATFDPRAIAVYPELGGIKVDAKKLSAFGKVDWVVTPSLSLTLGYGYNKDETPNIPFNRVQAAQGFASPSLLGTGSNETKRINGKLTFTTGSWVWESTATQFDYTNRIDPAFAGLNQGVDMEVRAASTTNNPLGAFDLWRSGQDPNASQNTGIKRLQWKNDVTYLTGGHAIKAGVDYQKQEYADAVYFWRHPTVGVWNVAGVAFGSEYSNTVAADVNLISVALRAPITQPGAKSTMVGTYLQDDWTVSPRLQVYVGARLDWDDQLSYLKQFDGLYATIHSRNPEFVGDKAPRDRKYFSPRIQVSYRPKEDDSLIFKLGAGRFVANTIDNVIGFSRALMANANGLPGGTIRNNAARAAQGLGPGANAIPNFSAGAVLTNVNGTNIVLPADLTPYNYVNNVNGLRDLFYGTIPGLLTPANSESAGKALLGSDFRYPTTDTYTLGMSMKFAQRHSLDLTLLFSKTKNASTLYGTDGSAPEASSTDAGGNELNDTLFVSNQTASSRQLQVKYQYTGERSTFIATFTAKDSRSSYGGSVGSFDNTGGADFYGAGVSFPWQTGPERRAGGSETFQGSLVYSYKASFGTYMSLLGNWHSGKAYDINLGFAPDQALDSQTGEVAHPIPVIGYQEGAWSMDLGLRIGHEFMFGKRAKLEPFVQISNLLNNYDYGANYGAAPVILTGTTVVPNDSFGKRLPFFQANAPRTIAFGARFQF